MTSAELILRSITAVLTALENGFICFLVVGNKNLRNATNGFVASLAFSDFLNGAVLIPLYLAQPTSEVIGYVVAFILLAGVGSVCAVTYDRYTAIASPFLYRYLTNKNFARITLFIWLGALAMSLVPLCWSNDRLSPAHKVYMFCLCAAVFLPYCVIFTAYLVTFKKLRRHFRCLRDIRTSHASRQITSERKLLRLMCAVTLLFIVCWLPTLYITVVDTIGRWDLIPKELDSVGLFGIQIHSLLNPLIYALKKDDFQDELRSLFYKCRWHSATHRIDPLNLVAMGTATTGNTTNNSPSLIYNHRRIEPSPPTGVDNPGLWI